MFDAMCNHHGCHPSHHPPLRCDHARQIVRPGTLQRGVGRNGSCAQIAMDDDGGAPTSGIPGPAVHQRGTPHSPKHAASGGPTAGPTPGTHSGTNNGTTGGGAAPGSPLVMRATTPGLGSRGNRLRSQSGGGGTHHHAPPSHVSSPAAHVRSPASRQQRAGQRDGEGDAEEVEDDIEDEGEDEAAEVADDVDTDTTVITPLTRAPATVDERELLREENGLAMEDVNDGAAPPSVFAENTGVDARPHPRVPSGLAPNGVRRDDGRKRDGAHSSASTNSTRDGKQPPPLRAMSDYEAELIARARAGVANRMSHSPPSPGVRSPRGSGFGGGGGGAEALVPSPPPSASPARTPLRKPASTAKSRAARGSTAGGTPTHKRTPAAGGGAPTAVRDARSASSTSNSVSPDGSGSRSGSADPPAPATTPPPARVARSGSGAAAQRTRTLSVGSGGLRRARSTSSRASARGAGGGGTAESYLVPLVELAPYANPHVAVKDALAALKRGTTQETWSEACEGLTIVRQLLRHSPETVVDSLHVVTEAIVKEVLPRYASGPVSMSGHVPDGLCAVAEKEPVCGAGLIV